MLLYPLHDKVTWLAAIRSNPVTPP